MASESGNLKRKALKIFASDDRAKKVFKDWEKSGMSQQDFFTIGALKALTKIYKKEDRYEEMRSVQIRLDETIHKLLKSKSKELNIPMEKLILIALEDLEENQNMI